MALKILKSIVSKIENTCVYDIAIRTPLEKASNLSRKLDNNIFIKRDDLQPIFSFKLRGAYVKIKNLMDKKKIKSIIAASGIWSAGIIDFINTASSWTLCQA